MISKLAIDVALLLPDEVMDEAIRLNRRFESRFVLNKVDHLPHITLSQAILKLEHLPEAKTRLKKISADFEPLHLKAFIVNAPLVMLEIARTKKLDSLHNKIMTKFKDLASYDVEESYFLDNHVRQKSLDYVRNFVSVAYDNYYPHITLGPEQVNIELNLEFTCDRLAICHLGNYNTCRKILFETSLS